MVYLGQRKIYEYCIEEEDMNKFLASLDFDNINVNRQKTSYPITWKCLVEFEDGSKTEDHGYRLKNMDKGFEKFDLNLLELVPFIEKPWLFTI